MSKYDEALGYLAGVWADSSPQTREAGFAELKRRGLSITETIKAVREVGQISLGQAKELVTSSPVWRQTAERAKPLHDDALAALASLDQVTARKVPA